MDIRIPEVGESVRDALLAKWFKKNGDFVKRDEPLCEIETDKITLDVNADVDGVVSILVEEGRTVSIGTVIANISEYTGTAHVSPDSTASAPLFSDKEEVKSAVSSPSIRREMREQGVDPDSVNGTGKGGRITLDDLFSRIEGKTRRAPAEDSEPASAEEASVVASHVFSSVSQPVEMAVESTTTPMSVHSEETPSYGDRGEERKTISPIRKRISERMVAVRQQTAMLTTFNEADMSHVSTLREKYREHFQLLHGAPLGLMPFFVKACVEALREYPSVNASIDGDDFVFYKYYDVGVAIGSEKGLVVPIIRNADKLKYYEIDQSIVAFKKKIAANRLSISDLTGGTFTVSNGGVYGSMLSTPILNPPQSAVLGMHSIQDRAVVRDGQIVIRPMMYLALSYDHRIIDGREAVGFLKKVKEYIEEPEELMLEG